MEMLVSAQGEEEGVVSAWSGQPEVRYARLGTGRVAYVEAGTGAPVVLVHGFGDHCFTWRYQLRDLAPVARVIALELPGHGHSDKPRRDYKPALYVDGLREFMDALGLGGATLVGNGMGATAALGLAVTHPRRAKSLVLIGPATPAAIPAGRVFDVLFALTRWPALARALFSLLPRAAARVMLRDAVADPASVDGELVGRYRALMRQPGFAWAFVSTAVHWRAWTDLRPQMGQIEQPTLLVWGEEDRVHPIRQAGLLRTLIPTARFLPLPGCGHLPQWERPNEVNAIIAEHLAAGA